ncbi:MAG: hypothetical protein EWM72_00303 [Nitrospira sp.]|nr:MAG: hypothetical protein EWM72_00303 [Nitrospira sp.]
MLLASFRRQHPGTIREGRLIPHMLPMAASQVGHPIALLILVIANNRLLHACCTIPSQ